MKKSCCLLSLIVLVLASCNAVLPLPPTTPFPSDTPLPTETIKPTNTPTRTPLPTATPLQELTADNVGLPWDNNSAIAQNITPVRYKPCYVNTETRWHDGDVFMWRLTGKQVIDVLSPVEGEILYSILQNFGANIIIKTPYLYGGKQVYMQLRHFDSLDDTAKKGLYVSKGQHIGTLRAGGEVDPGGNNILDLKLYKGDDWHYDTATAEGRAMFFDTAPYHLDDLELIPHNVVPRCEGNAIDFYLTPPSP